VRAEEVGRRLRTVVDADDVSLFEIVPQSE
jgi:hypothetical protein